MIDAILAQDIVNRMKNIIQQELNFFSIDGTIIASTDMSRIGQQNHQGAQFVIENNQSIVIEYDDQYKGAKQGINLPVAIDHKMVGVIGITGKKEEVAQYGEIIKEMTKVLIINNMTREVVYNRRNAHKNILEFIQNSNSVDNQRSLEMLYGINLDNHHYTAIAGLPINISEDYFFEQHTNLYLDLENLLGNDQRNIFEIRGNLFLALLPTKNVSKISETIQKLCQLLSSKYQISMIFGYGISGKGKEELKNSIDQAKTALSWNMHFYQKNELAFTDMGVGLVLHDVSSANKSNFLNDIFKNMTPQEVDMTISLLDTYEACNGSIKKCAELLFIHKNTVQYQLTKIADLTGYDPRVLSDFFILKLASILYKIQD